MVLVNLLELLPQKLFSACEIAPEHRIFILFIGNFEILNAI